MDKMPQNFSQMLGVTPQSMQAQQPAMLNDKKLLNFQQMPSLWAEMGLSNLMGLTGQPHNPVFGQAMYPRKVGMDALNPSSGQAILNAYPHGWAGNQFPAMTPKQQAEFQAMLQALQGK